MDAKCEVNNVKYLTLGVMHDEMRRKAIKSSFYCEIRETWD